MKVKELGLVVIAALVGAGPVPAAEREKAAPNRAPSRTVRPVPLPGAPPEGVFMDYLAYDRAHRRVWVPAGNTGSVDVIDAASGKLSRVEGFATKEMERKDGTKRIVGPSSATVGDGVVYVGNRADSSICAVGAESLKIASCVKLESMPDGLAYVASRKEVWVTTPRDKSITVVDAASAEALKVKTTIDFEGEPEGYAVDETRGVFYTNLEDKDRTLAVDLATRKVTRTWLPACGEDGPKGLALDHARNFLIVACSDHVLVLDAGHDGKRLSEASVGDGIDNIDYVESRHELYAAAGRAARLAVEALDDQGALEPVATVDTAPGARNAVATETGVAYLTDSKQGRILVVEPAPSHP